MVSLMARIQEKTGGGPWILEAVPFMVVVLITAHVLALVYWIYRLATEKQPPFPFRRKEH